MSCSRSRVLFLLGIVLSLAASTSASLPPVVWVPGWGTNDVDVTVATATAIAPGCPLQAKFRVQSGAINQQTPGVNVTEDCVMRWLATAFNADTGLSTDVAGVTATAAPIDDFASSYAYDPLYKFYSDNGYIKGQDFRVVNYDWRRAAFDQKFYNDLQATIEDTYTKNGNKPVVLSAHSTGPLMCYYFLLGRTQEWKNKYIRLFLPLSGNVGGQGDPTSLILGGGIVSGEYSDDWWYINQNWTSNAWQFPNSFYFTNQPIVATPNATYIADKASILQLLKDSGSTLAVPVYDKVFNNTGELQSPQVNTACLYGAGLETLVGVRYNTTWADGPSSDINVIGDDNQSWYTNQACLSWRKPLDASGHTFKSQAFQNVTHMGMTYYPEVLAEILTILKGLSEDAGVNHEDKTRVLTAASAHVRRPH